MNHSKYYLAYANLCYGGMITFHFFFVCFFFVCFFSGGGGWCKATYWLRGISSSFINFTLGVSVVILDGASIVQMLKGVGVITVQ